MPEKETLLREKGRDLTQSYDKSPYTNRNVKRAKWQHKQRHKKVFFFFSISQFYCKKIYIGWHIIHKHITIMNVQQRWQRKDTRQLSLTHSHGLLFHDGTCWNLQCSKYDISSVSFKPWYYNFPSASEIWIFSLILIDCFLNFKVISQLS